MVVRVLLGERVGEDLRLHSGCVVLPDRVRVDQSLCTLSDREMVDGALTVRSRAFIVVSAVEKLALAAMLN